MQHLERPAVPGWAPAHVTVRVREGLPSLRGDRFVEELRGSLREVGDRGDFRVVHYSVRSDHVQFLVEAAGKRALASGMKSIGARLARAAHRAFALAGPILHGRYDVRVLKTPQEVRDALASILLGMREDGRKRSGTPARSAVLDDASSARWFDGWSPRVAARSDSPSGEREVAPPRTWLVRTGWRRHGLLDPTDPIGED